MEKERILIVEDEIIVARDLQRDLEKMGYAVASMVPSGEQAIQEIENQVPDLVLMDIMLQEEMDGIETAEIIRSRFDIPVIFLTAYGDKATFERAKKSEPLGYIIKPFHEENLRKVIEIALLRHKAEQKRVALARKQRKELNGFLKKYIIKHRSIEEALRLSKEQMQSILDNTTSVIYLKDLQGKYIFINRQYQELFHVTKEGIVGKTDYDIFTKEMADAFRANDQKVIKARTPLEMEEVALHDDGLHTYISIKFPLFDSNGAPYGVCGISTDITGRKKTEDMLREQKKSLEQKNIALNEVLKQIEIEKRQMEENVIANAENLLLPTIHKLGLTRESRKYAQMLHKNLEELTSSFGTRLTDKKTRLTSKEIEICNMIKNGLASKEIALLLNTSLLTVEKHRNNIRSKLGVVNNGSSLFSVLQEL